MIKMIWQTIYLDKRFRLLKSFQCKQPTEIRERCFGLLIQICTLGKWVKSMSNQEAGHASFIVFLKRFREFSEGFSIG